MSFFLLPFAQATQALCRFLSIGFLVFFPLILAAGSTDSAWSIRVWRTDDGLPNNYVTGLAQTPDGYLWVATYSSPARFDGARFEQKFFPEFANVTREKITALERTRDGGLWMGALHGTVFLLNSKGLQTFTEGLPDKQIQTLTEDAEGSLWVCFQGGAVSRIKNGRITSFTVDDGLPNGGAPESYVCSLARDAQGRLWFAKGGQVGIFRGERFVTLIQLRTITARVACARGGGIWICSGERLLKYDEGKPLEDHGTFESRLSNSEPTAVLEDRRDSVWIGTSDRGLFRYDGSTFEHVPTSDQRISTLAEDRKGDLWVGTASGGLNRVHPRVIELETMETGLPSPAIQSICQDSEGAVWATTQNGLLIRKRENAWTTISAEANWPGGRASAVTADPAGGIWIGTRDRALHHWRDGQFASWRRAEGLASREIHALLVSKAGDLWIGETSSDVVQRLRGGQLKTFRPPLQDVRVIRAMTEDVAGNIWVGTSKGTLLKIAGDAVTEETAATTGSPLSIRCVHATPDGGLWIGYADEGMGWWKDGKFAHFTSARGFPEANVSQITSDGQGWLWFAGDHGIFKARQSDLEERGAGRATQVHTIRYGQSEGLFSLEANFGDSPGTLQGRDGRLWIPMRTALAIVYPNRLREDFEPPAMLLKRVMVDDQMVALYGGLAPVHGYVDLHSPAATLRVPPGHIRLEFEFTAMSFSAPENVRFRYRVEGFDRDWIAAGTQRTARYSRLAAGDYRFHVQACNSDGIWNEQGASLPFVVTPFMWQTAWFRLSSFLAFTALVAAIARTISLRRVRLTLRQLEQQAALDKERTRIARDLHDEFGTRLTELGLIAELERQSSFAQGTATSIGSDLVENIRSLERDLDTIVWAVNPKNDSLDHLIGFICRVTGEFLARSQIRCRFDIPEELPSRVLNPELRHHLYLVVREAVSNVVKHSSATMAKLSIAVEGDRVHFRLEDDGCGFTLATVEAGARNGLINMRHRIEEMGGTFEVCSAPGEGTIIQFHVTFETPSKVPGRAENRSLLSG